MLVPKIIAAGANIIGGCCGTTPMHICRVREEVNKI
jgi:5-methyltetrahydrofolate--homocysteine methyltransferase